MNDQIESDEDSFSDGTHAVLLKNNTPINDNEIGGREITALKIQNQALIDNDVYRGRVQKTR